uniref:hypothetical protein n=1 Tax=Gordonia sp. B7-2 TaxID=3420932 RepID=UPI003D8CA52F
MAGTTGVLALLSALPVFGDVTRVLLLAPMLTVGLGVALTRWVDMPGHLKPALYPAIGLAASIGLATSLLWLRSYSPVAVTITLATVCLLSAAMGLRTLDDMRTSGRALAVEAADSLRSLAALRNRHLLPLAGAIILWIVGLVQSSSATVGLYGLLATPGGLLIGSAVVLTIVAFVWCLRSGDTQGGAACVVAVIAFIRLPVTVLTDVPIYAWTYKHIGLVDYVAQTGALPAPYIDIYTRWPGFFAGAAWFSSATGVDPVAVAHWFAPVIHCLLAAGIWSLARALRLSAGAALAAMLCAELVNWVGQDYYSPQAIALVLAVAVLALIAGARKHTAPAYFAIPIFAVIAVSHQLTPMWVLACGALLTALNRVRPLWLVLALAATWLGYVGPRLSSVIKYGLFTGSNPVKNAQTNIGGATGDSPARTLTEAVDRGVAFAVWIAAAIAFLYLWRRGRPDWALPVIAFSPILLLAGQSYGGEAIFRVYLYSVIGCSIMIGAAIAAALRDDLPGRPLPATVPRRRIRTGIVTVLLGAVAVGALHGYYSGWAYNVITPSQVALSRQMLAQAEPSTVIVRMAPAGWPERPSGDYVRIAEANPGYDRPLVFLKNSLSRGFPTEDDIKFMNNLGRMSSGGFYLVLPRQISIYSDYFGYFRKGAIENLVVRLDREPRWQRAPGDADTIIFRYVPESADIARPAPQQTGP